MKERFVIKVKQWHTGKDEYYWTLDAPFTSPYTHDIRCAEQYETYEAAKDVISQMKGSNIYQIEKIFVVENGN